jgi:hypothetical protein
MEGEIWKRRVPAPGLEVWNLSVKVGAEVVELQPFQAPEEGSTGP